MYSALTQLTWSLARIDPLHINSNNAKWDSPCELSSMRKYQNVKCFCKFMNKSQSRERLFLWPMKAWLIPKIRAVISCFGTLRFLVYTFFRIWPHIPRLLALILKFPFYDCHIDHKTHFTVGTCGGSWAIRRVDSESTTSRVDSEALVLAVFMNGCLKLTLT